MTNKKREFVLPWKGRRCMKEVPAGRLKGLAHRFVLHKAQGHLRAGRTVSLLNVAE